MFDSGGSWSVLYFGPAPRLGAIDPKLIISSCEPEPNLGEAPFAGPTLSAHGVLGLRGRLNVFSMALRTKRP